MVRGTGILPFPPVAVYEILVNLDKKTEWNGQFSMLDVVEEVDERTKVG